MKSVLCGVSGEFWRKWFIRFLGGNPAPAPTHTPSPSPSPNQEAQLLESVPLMSGWEQVDDPAQGAYYYNSGTGETTRERPAMPADKGRGKGGVKPSEPQGVQEAYEAERGAFPDPDPGSNPSPKLSALPLP